MVRKLKPKGGIPDELMPKIKEEVTVRQLEDIALRSQMGLEVKKSRLDSRVEMMKDPRYRRLLEDVIKREKERTDRPPLLIFDAGGNFIGVDGVEAYSRQLGVDIRKTITELRGSFRGETLIVADVNCNDGGVAAQLNQMDGVEAFGTGGKFWWTQSSGLPRERYIVEEANDLAKTIPENSFHFMVSRVMEKYFEEVPRLFPSMYKVLRPGGLAVFDLEFWWEKIEEILSLKPEIQSSLTLVNRKTGYSNNLTGYLADIEKQREGMGDATLTHFEMCKPL